MKMRNKGKVHPLGSSSSSSSSNQSYPDSRNDFPVLKLLPAAILALISVLSFEDREVLAYMISRSLKLTNPSAFATDDKKKSFKKSPADGHGHKPLASFDCECFDCYTSFWSRWDSSPNRELIHQAIEAFEEHSNSGEQSKKGKNRKKEKVGRRKGEKLGEETGVLDFPEAEGKTETESLDSVLPETEAPVIVPEKDDIIAAESAESEVKKEDEQEVPPKEEVPVAASRPSTAAVNSHKGLARKVLPDVLGLFNSRFWSLLNPNV